MEFAFSKPMSFSSGRPNRFKSVRTDAGRSPLTVLTSCRSTAVRSKLRPDHLNGCGDSRDQGKLCVAGDQRGVERFREGKIGGVVGCAVNA